MGLGLGLGLESGAGYGARALGLGLGQRCSVLAFISSIMAAMYLGATSHTLRTSSSRVSKESEIHTEGAWVSATCVVAEGWRVRVGG